MDRPPSWLRKRAQVLRKRRVPGHQLCFEELEPRVLLDTRYWWVGMGADANWSTLANWRTAANNPATPGADAFVIFDKITGLQRNPKVDRLFIVHDLLLTKAFFGTMTLAENLDVVGGHFTMHHGVIQGSGDLNLGTNNESVWDSGSIAGLGNVQIGFQPPMGPGVIGTLHIQSSEFSNPVLDKQRQMIINKGSIVDWDFGDFVVTRGASINNEGTFQVKRPITVDMTLADPFPTNEHFYNRGLFIVNAGPLGNVSIQVNFQTFAPVQPFASSFQIKTGNVKLEAGGYISGRVDINGGSLLEFVDNLIPILPSRPYIWDGALFQNSGNVDVRGVVKLVNRPSGANRLEFNRGSIEGSAGLTIIQNFKWKDGRIGTPVGQETFVTLSPDCIAAFRPGGLRMFSAQIANFGLVQLFNGQGVIGTLLMKNSNFTNYNNFDIRDDSGISGDPNSLFWNVGVFQKTDGGGESKILVPFLSGGVGLAAVGLPLPFSLILAKSGTITFGRAVQMAGGQAVLEGGAIKAINAPFLMTGGALVGNGTIYATVLNTGGEIDPGGIGVIGTITIASAGTSPLFAGDYIETGTGTINIEIASSTSADRLNVAGQCLFNGYSGFNGSLAEIFLMSPLPTSGSWTVVTYSSHTGQVFAGLPEGWQVNNVWYYFIPTYMTSFTSDTALTLTVESAGSYPPPFVPINDFPSSGSNLGGSVFTLEDQGFTQTQNITCVEKYFVNSDSTITVMTAPGGGPLYVYTLQSVPKGTYTLNTMPAPAVTGVTPNSDPVDAYSNIVTITGSNFTGASLVDFGSTSAFFKIMSDSSIIALAPTILTGGTEDITVTTPSGTSATGSADRFTYNVPPAAAVTSVSPTSGGSDGSAVVTITGSGFSGAYDVSFGGVSANFTINSDTSITALAPPQAAGPVDVIVTSSEGSSTATVADRFNYTAVGAPTVTSITPTSGSTGGGTAVNITGTNFSGASDVFFGSVEAASFTIISSTSITAVAPPEAAGTYDITVMTPSGVSATSSSDRYTFTAAPAPTITAITPATGTSAGGTVVTVTGTNFTGASAVNFGTTPAASFTILSDTSMTVTAPPVAGGTYDITVTTPSGTSATGSGDQFTVTAAPAPSVTAITPSSGSAAGGTTVTITGSSFTGASAVNFGAVAATDFTVVSDTSITAISPAQTGGTFDITVVTPTGTSSTSSADQFTFTAIPVPAITSIGTSSGTTAGGTAVIITGSGFTGATAVSFGPASAASFTVNGDGQIVAVTPPNPAGTWDISVTTAGGTSALSSGDRFTFTAAAAPAITSISPTSGTSAGATIVSITGTAFTGASGVTFGGLPGGFTVVSDTSIIATAPPEAAGTYDIIVTTPTGTSAVGTADHFTYTAAAVPSVTAVSPSTDTSAGGFLTTITGTAFTGASAVNFGTVAAAGFWVINDTTIIAVSPPQAAATVDITVTTPSGTSATGSADHFVVTAAAAPSVTLVTPSSGAQSGGTTVVIIGSGFTGASAVSFGTAPAASFTVNSDSSITAVSPYGATASQVDITVTTPSGTSATGAADKFTYTYVSGAAPAITSVAPNTGTTAGGTLVTVSGSGFTGAMAVKFGSTVASSFTVISDSQLTATSPAGSAGTVDITVTTPSGTSSTGATDHFTYVAASVPTVTGVSPNTGTTTGGTSVTITGTNFTGATAVTFGGVAATSFTVNSSTSITATSPPEATGTVDITVTSQAGTSATSSSDHFTYTAASLPTVTGLSPTSGGTGGGTSVTITGTNLTGAIAVYFGGVPATSFTINSGTQITATSPAQSAGTLDVTVVTFAGTSALSTSDRFAYNAAGAPAVTSNSPNTGSTAGGTSVTVTGSGFTGATGVFFGGVAAASFTVNSDTSITATSPSQAAATVDITVATFTGTSATGTADHFTYTNAAVPSVTGVSPGSGSTGGGTSVTITGTSFTGATVVNFGTVAASSFTVNSDTSITATSPPEAAGTVDITVTTPSGTSATGTADHYTYTAAAVPAITSVSPSSGTIAGGTVVTIIGTSFTGASAVNFGSTAASTFSVVSDTAIVATVPAGAAGTVDITVVTPSGTSSTGSADHYTYSAGAVPAVTSLSPTSGTTGGGTVVTITGSGFTGATGVTFGDTAAAGFTVISDTSIQAVSPAHPGGTWDIIVTGPGGTSAAVSGDRYTFNSASAAAVTGVSPNSGNVAGGTSVIITGTGFTGSTGVFFGEVAATSFTVNSDTSITATSPANPAGTVDVTVNTFGGFSATSASDHFTYTVPAPTVTGVTPTSGSTAGGTGVTITGTHFTGASAVTFGTVAASGFSVVNDTTITATSPSEAAGTIDITVTTPGGTSGTGSADHFTYNAAALPSITAVNPNSGSTAGGTIVSITGSNFTGATTVNFGSTAALGFKVISDTSITATAPAESAATIDITVTTASGTSTTSSSDYYTFNAPSAPTVTAVSPTSGTTGGGTAVTITGTNFNLVTGITFGGTPASSFSDVSSTTVTVVAPAHAAGTVDILVTAAGGTSAIVTADHFTYSAAAAPAITSISPTSGSSKGGTGVTINGSGFTGASTVKFGSVAAVSFVVNSDTKITATSPPEAAGTVDITVTTPTGTSATGSADQFTYSGAAVPTVTGLSTSSGSTNGTTQVTIIGTGFTGATSVNFGSGGSMPVAFGGDGIYVNSDTEIVALAPIHSTGTIDVTVTSNSGTSSTNPSDQFTYVAAPIPSVTQVAPTSIYTTGGAVVTILGSGFTGATGVTFGSIAATSFTIYPNQTIVAVAPAQSAGTVDVKVTSKSGTSSTSSADQVTYTIPPPSITGLSPGSGGYKGGTSVTITGTAFTGASSVKFGAINATSYTVNSDTQITATSPRGSIGTVDVTVTTSYGTSAIVFADQFTYIGTGSPLGATGSGGGGGSSPALATNISQGTIGTNINPTSQTGPTSQSLATSTSSGPLMSTQFLISENDLRNLAESANLWSSEKWTNHLADSLQTIESPVSRTSALLLSVTDNSNSPSTLEGHSSVIGTVPSSKVIRSHIWSEYFSEGLVDNLTDFFFSHDFSSVDGKSRDREIGS